MGVGADRGVSISVLVGAMLAGWPGVVASAAAQAPETSAAVSQARLQYDIAAQPLSSALNAFARQSGVRVLYRHDELAARSAPLVRGSYTREEALQLLLAGSGFRAELNGSGAVRLVSYARPQQPGADRGGDVVRNPAQTDSEDRRSAPLDEAAVEDAIVVTGTNIRGAHPAGANVLILDRAKIKETGRSTLTDALQTLPQVFPGSQGETTQLLTTDAGSNIAFGSTVDLRGLGADATLILLNGRRLAPAGFGNFVDISAIPLAAVERVDVLADGASATYGSDAVGGVANIVLRRDFEGAETSLRLGGATEGGLGERGFSHVWGATWARGSLVAGYEYRDRERLAAADRAFAADTDLTALGGDNFSRTFASPGTITRVGSTSATFAIPDNQDGTNLEQAELLAGQVNFENGNLDVDLVPEQISHSFFGSLRWDAADRLEVFADFIASSREARSRDTQITGTLSVPSSNAYRQLNNLFPGAGNLSIAYSFYGEFGPVHYTTQSDTISALTGAGLDLAHGWRAEASASYGWHSDDVLFDNAADTSVLAPLLASSSRDAAFNPFSSNGDQPAAVLAQLRRSQRTENESALMAYAVKADGPLFNLPGGALRLAIGAERRDESFEIWRTRTSGSGAVTVQDALPDGERATDALYAELLAPLVGGAHPLPLAHRLDLSLSVRREHSDDYGAATTPKVGVGWALNPAFQVRGTWGTSFKAPRFDQTLAGISAVYGVATLAIDPFATNGGTGLLQVFGGNPDLEPEEAEIWTAGFDYAPTWLEGFSAHTTYYEIDFANRIAIAGGILDVIRNASAFPNNLFRDPPPEVLAFYSNLAPTIAGTPPPDGVELIFDGRLSNVASQNVRGVDLNLSYDINTELGALSFFVSASHMLEFSQSTNPAAPILQQLNTVGKPVDWRARLGASWSNERWRTGAVVNYVNDYVDMVSAPSRSVASWTTWDVQASRRWGMRDPAAQGVELALNVRNLFNEDPPFVNNLVGIGFDPANASPVGRTLSLEARRRW